MHQLAIPTGWLQAAPTTNLARGVFIVTELGIGGAETMLFRLLSRMNRDKYSDVVISLKGHGPVGEWMEQIGIPVHHLGWHSALQTPESFKRLRALIRSINPDFIQGWMLHANLAAQAAASGLRRQLPVIWNMRHSLDDLSTEKVSTKALVHSLGLISSWADRIVYNSRSSALQHERRGYNAERTVLIPNGFDCQVFRPRPDCRGKMRAALGLPADVPLIGIFLESIL